MLVGVVVMAGVVAAVALVVFCSIPELALIGAVLAVLGIYALVVSVKYLRERIGKAPEVRQESSKLHTQVDEQEIRVKELENQRKELHSKSKLVDDLQGQLRTSINKVNQLDRQVQEKNIAMQRLAQAQGPNGVANELLEQNCVLEERYIEVQEQLARARIVNRQDVDYEISLGIDKVKQPLLDRVKQLEKAIEQKTANSEELAFHNRELEELIRELREKIALLEARIVEIAPLPPQVINPKAQRQVWLDRLAPPKN